MKIGILTFHCAHNYGAMLQAYATQELLRGAGHDVEIIDYRPDYLVKPYKVFCFSRFYGGGLLKSLRKMVSELVLWPVRVKRFKAFERFMDSKLTLSERVTHESFKGDYDAVVIGSDQVWNSRITGGSLDMMYLALFPFEKGARKYIADAVSMASDTIAEADRKSLETALPAFDLLTVRESGLVELLDGISPLRPVHIQDPVLHVGKEIWEGLARPSRRRSPYVLLYQIRHDRRIDEFAREAARRRCAQLVEISAFPNAGRLFKASQTVGVEDFLGLVAGAECIVTTSFHATVFSVIFHKTFHCFSFGDGRDSRLSSFLDVVGLSDRLHPVDSCRFTDSECRYDGIDMKLEEIRRNSAGYILDSIEKGGQKHE